MRRTVLFLTIVCFMCLKGLFAQEVFLKNGDRLVCDEVIKKNDVWIIKHPVLGTLEVQVKDIIKKKADTKNVKQNELQRDFSLGYEQKRGNTESRAFSSDFRLRRKGLFSEDELKLALFYSSSDNKMDQQQFRFMGRRGVSFGEEMMWYWFAKAEFWHDKFAAVKARWLPSVGIGYWFSDEMPFKAMLEGSLGYQITDFYGWNDDGEVMVIMRGFLSAKIFDSFILTQDLAFYPSVQDVDNYRLISETSLSLPIKDNLSVKISLLDEYDNSPAQDKKKNDLHLISALSWSF